MHLRHDTANQPTTPPQASAARQEPLTIGGHCTCTSKPAGDRQHHVIQVNTLVDKPTQRTDKADAASKEACRLLLPSNHVGEDW